MRERPGQLSGRDEHAAADREEHEHEVRDREHALGAQSLQLFVQQVRRGGSVRAKDAVPGQVVAVLGEGAADHARRGSTGQRCDVAVRRDCPRGYVGDDCAYPLVQFVVHDPGNDSPAEGCAGAPPG